MQKCMAIGASMLVVGTAWGGIFDDFEGFQVGEFPGGIWQDAADFITNPSNPGPTASVISTTDAFGNATQAVQILDGLGTSGGVGARVEHSRIQRFETDLRFDQASDGNYPNWVAAAGFFQETDQRDLISMPQAVIYSLNTSRKFRLYIHNGDGNGGIFRDIVLGDAEWDFDTWYRVALEVDTETGEFTSSVVDLASGEEIIASTTTVNNWNSAFGQYDVISVNDGEYGNQHGTRGNMATMDNIRYTTPTPGSLVILCGAGLFGGARRRRAPNVLRQARELCSNCSENMNRLDPI